MALPAATIGQWTVTQLVRFIKDILKNDPPSNFMALRASTLKVADELIVSGKLTFDKDKDWQPVGGNGQPAFANGWLDWGAPYNSVSFWKDPLGIVRLRGVLKSGTVGSTAFTLPPGYRPGATKLLVVLSNNAVGRLDIASDGTVTPQLPSSNVYLSLDGLQFQAS